MTPLAPLPTLRRPQQLDALALGNAIRLERGRLKRELASVPRPEALTRAADLISNPPPHVAKMRLGALLKSCRGIGPFQVSRLLRPCLVSEQVQLCNLTDRQRGTVVEALGERAAA